MKRETVAEYLARGGKITVLPAGMTTEHDGLTEAQRQTKARYHKRAGESRKTGHKRYRDGKGVEA